MNKFQNSVMMNVEAKDDRNLIAVSCPDQAKQLHSEGWAMVFFKEFQFRLDDTLLEVQVSKPAQGKIWDRYQRYNAVTAASLACSPDCEALSSAARSLFGAYGLRDQVFWHHSDIDAVVPRTCGVFRQVDMFTPCERGDDHIVTFDLEDLDQMLGVQEALGHGTPGPMARWIGDVERQLVYQAVSNFEPVYAK
jgi:hypothetical protein